jgi:cellulose synthase/poly-beta-1,6-N-acetylglucosamine synthase-like glycosyltransferase
MAVELIFWLTCGLVVYAYIGYPFCITLMSFIVNSKVAAADIQPFVSLVISAYNEEKDIGRKIENSLSLDYPKDKLEIIVASDGSTDSTDTIVRRYEKNKDGIAVVLHRVEGRLGKTAAQNSAVRICQGDVIVFSDAASLYDRGALRALARNYADPTIGAVSGMYKYINKTGASVGFATILFWNIENFIKSRQTKVKTVTGCCGCIYSVRKSLYTELPPTIISDLVEPLAILKKGYRIVFEPNALAFEETTEKPKDEFKMRVRVIVRGMNGLLYMRSLLNPFKNPFIAFQLISHKVLRWLVPIFCVIILCANILLAFQSLFYQIVLLLQVVFYLMAIMGFVLEKKGIKKKIFYITLYFTIVNAASLVSMIKVFRGENIVIWQTQR